METPAAPRPNTTRRSCLVCSAAKVKCNLSENSSGSGAGACARCRRLGKECVMQAVVPRKPRARKRTTKVAQLEQKLDGLVQLLTSKDQEQGSYPSPESVAGRVVAGSPSSATYPQMADDSLARGSSLPLLLSISDEYAQECFLLYKQKQMPNFPFIVVPPQVTAKDMRDKKPALFGAIVVASSFKNIITQIAYGEELLRYLIDKILIKGEKNLELLQALLIYTAWYHNVVHFKRRITHLASMLSALVTDLGLARASSVNERLTITIEETRGSYGCTNVSGVRTLEERRAYLGAFYISSTISATFRDLNALRRSAYLEDCCKTLERAAEFPSDRFLVSLLRLQNHVERTAHTFQYGSLEPHSRHNWRVPLTLYMVPLEKDLENFRTNLPRDLQDDHIMMLHYWSAMAYLFEFSLYEPIQESYAGQPCCRRMEYLYACLQAIKRFYSELFSIPTSEYYYMPLFNCTQVTHWIMTLSKLCFLHAEDWNVAHAREESDFANLLEQIASKLEEARAIQDAQQGGSPAAQHADASVNLRNGGGGTAGLDYSPSSSTPRPRRGSEMRIFNAWLESREHANDNKHPCHRTAIIPTPDQTEDIFTSVPVRLRMFKAKYEKKAAEDAAALALQQEPTTFPIGPNHLFDGTSFDIMAQMEDEAFWKELMGGTWVEGADGLPQA